jgi:hypothetical protein
VLSLVDSNPKFFQSAPGGRVLQLQQYSWRDFMAQVAMNAGRREGFSEEDLGLSSVLAANIKGREELPTLGQGTLMTSLLRV